MLDRGGFVVSLPSYDVPPSGFGVAAGESDVTAVWTGYDYATGASAIYATRVSDTGAVLDQARVADDGSSPQVAWDGRRYLVTWAGADADRTILALRIHKGKPDRDPIAVSSGAAWKMYPKVASDGNSFLVVWTELRSGQPPVYGRRIDDSGKLLDPAPVTVLDTPDFDDATGVAWNGLNYLVSSHHQVVRVTCRAEVLDPGGVPITTPPSWVEVTDLAAGASGDVAMLLNHEVSDAPYNGADEGFVRFVHDAGVAGAGTTPGNGAGRNGSGQASCP